VLSPEGKRTDMTEEQGIADRRASRRVLLKGAVAGAGALWVAPAIDSFVTPAAAASTVTSAGANLQKDPDGTLALRCLNGCNGQCSNAGRGSVTFTRSAGSPATICAAITIASGPSITGRQVYIQQSNGTTCLSSTLVGTWAASPANGPQTFCVAVATGATRFSVHMPISGGGGTDIYTSDAVTLP
jgi:hypothetical protein